MELSALFKDVASIIAEKCINPNTQRPYTISMIERALRDVHFSVDTKRSAKQQALHVRPLCPLHKSHAHGINFLLEFFRKGLTPKHDVTAQAGPNRTECMQYRLWIVTPKDGYAWIYGFSLHGMSNAALKL